MCGNSLAHNMYERIFRALAAERIKLILGALIQLSPNLSAAYLAISARYRMFIL